jgi:hypothetical protein
VIRIGVRPDRHEPQDRGLGVLRRAATFLALLGALDCNGPAADTGFASSQAGPTSVPGGSSTSAAESSSSDGGDTTASAEDSGAGTTEPVRDLGGEPDFGPNKPLGCKGKIDFLFLISRFGNMKTEQKQLLASFPDFIDTIDNSVYMTDLRGSDGGATPERYGTYTGHIPE